MAFDCPALELESTLRQERIVLVRTTDAIRLCRDGSYERVAPHQTSWLVGGVAQREMASLRSFLWRARLFSIPLRSLDDAQVRLLLQQAVRTQDVSAIRRGDSAGNRSDSTAEQRRLVRAIRAKSHGRLSYHGRSYELVADVDLGRLPDRDRYEVVGNADAAEVLLGLAQAPGTEPELARLLREARGKLSRDWRPPLWPDGLILLRRIVVQQAVSHAAEVMTPSQMKKALTKTEWIEIVLKDELGQPYRGSYEIELPDATTTTGNFDEEGLWGDYDIEPGSCKLLVPEVREAVKPGAPPPVVEQTWIALKVVDEDGKPVIGRTYLLKLTNGTERRGVTADGEIRVEPLPAGTCMFSLALGEAPQSCASAAGEGNADEEGIAGEEGLPCEDHPPGDGIIDAIAEDAAGKPIPDQPFEAHFCDGTVKKGRTDGSGRVHLEGCPGDACIFKMFSGESTA